MQFQLDAVDEKRRPARNRVKVVTRPALAGNRIHPAGRDIGSVDPDHRDPQHARIARLDPAQEIVERPAAQHVIPLALGPHAHGGMDDGLGLDHPFNVLADQDRIVLGMAARGVQLAPPCDDAPDQCGKHRQQNAAKSQGNERPCLVARSFQHGGKPMI